MRQFAPTRLVLLLGLVFLAVSCPLTGCHRTSGGFEDDSRTVGPGILRIADEVNLTVPEGYEAWTTDEPYPRVDVFRSDVSLQLVVDVAVLPSDVASETLAVLRGQVDLRPSPLGLESWEWGLARESKEESPLLARATKRLAGRGIVVNVYRAALETEDDSAAEVLARFLHE